jgi:asparagine synthase (glutamine-hydrolysing)
VCGIAGLAGKLPDGVEEVLASMAHALRHRGPDGSGSWLEPTGNVGLAHSRLKVLDLYPTGSQPMLSASGRYVVTYNGELYNWAELRRELDGHPFRGRSDTEVLLAAVDAWGVERALERANGMFAFGLWDRERGVLHLVRDRVGKKPLYYGWSGGCFVFASELKAFWQVPGFAPALDVDALAAYMRFGCVPSPRSIFRGVHKLPPASRVEVSPEDVGALAPPVRYWSLESLLEEASPAGDDPEGAMDLLESALLAAVRDRMVSDVPVGALLSAGIDSATVVSLMQSASDRPVRTFTVSFAEAGYDEGARAARIAQHLGTEHTSVRIDSAEVLSHVAELGRVYDEPFADSSQLPTLVISGAARRSVTVALTGDGGDELFGGYARYLWAGRLERALRVPAPARTALAAAIRSVPPAGFDAIGRALRFGGARPGEKAHKLAAALACSSAEGIYDALTSWHPHSAGVLLEGSAAPPATWGDSVRRGSRSFLEWMMLADASTYLPDDVLTKVDRASMAHGLEVRSPLLDLRVIALAARLPVRFKVRDGVGKWLLRRLAERRIPARLLDQPKMGFAVPMGDWLRGPLRPWAESLLERGALQSSGVFDPDPVRARWTEHLSGRRDWQHHIWSILMLESWLAETRSWRSARTGLPDRTEVCT